MDVQKMSTETNILKLLKSSIQKKEDPIKNLHEAGFSCHSTDISPAIKILNVDRKNVFLINSDTGKIKDIPDDINILKEIPYVDFISSPRSIITKLSKIGILLNDVEIIMFDDKRPIAIDKETDKVYDAGTVQEISDWIFSIDPSKYVKFNQDKFNELFWTEAFPLFFATANKEETEKVMKNGKLPDYVSNFENLDAGKKYCLFRNNAEEFKSQDYGFHRMMMVDIRKMKSTDKKFKVIRAFDRNNEKDKIILRYLILDKLGIPTKELQEIIKISEDDITDCWIATLSSIPPEFISEMSK